MKLLSFSISFIILLTLQSVCQEKRALLIGITQYSPDPQTAAKKGSEWKNLRGCINDVNSVKSVLMTAKFGFEEENITILTNEQATRDGIFKGIDNLTEACEEGDIAFVFYSGHGAQVKNSLSKDERNDFKDEAIVPFDAIFGAKYIRDKELAPRFNKILDKGVLLTIVFDCCHSGSLTRGNPPAGDPMLKLLPMDTRDVRDGTTIPVKPKDKGALIISASQDYEPAKEKFGDDEEIHGAFTEAFCRALNQSPPGESAYKVFNRICAIIPDRGIQQKPEIECNLERGNKTILGDINDKYANSTVIAVRYVMSDEGSVELSGGTALGIVTGSKFRHVVNKEVEVEVTGLEGVATSTAKVISGDIGNIRRGDLFELVNWGIPDRPFLYVYAAPDDIAYPELIESATRLRQFVEANKINWITQPEKQKPSSFLTYTLNGWNLKDTLGLDIIIGDKLDINQIKTYLIPGQSSLYFDVPPFSGMMQKVQLGKNTSNTVVQFSFAEIADYKLSGRWVDDRLEYSWILPGVVESIEFQSTLPVSTNWFQADNSTAGIQSVGDSLTEYALRLGRIMRWLNLPSPGSSFPFHLGLMNMSSGQVIREGTVKGGERYYMVLERDKNQIMWDGAPRWVYVFSIDRDGKMLLNFPLRGSENRFPPPTYAGEEVSKLSGNRIVVSEPYGYDTYFLLVTSEKIDAPEYVFSSEAVRSMTKGNLSPLEQLLVNNNKTTRSGPPRSPKSWSLERVVVKSVEK